jgi:hypothetical protein
MERKSLFHTIFSEVAIDGSITIKKEIFCISNKFFYLIGIFTPLNLSIALKYNIYTIFYEDLVPIFLKAEEE